jgi:uroporphyrinogen III methyltransferase/synthase
MKVMSMKDSCGKVYLVGAGPGDPGLLTVRGRECLLEADLVIYDYLANATLLEFSPRAALIYVGKQKSNHTLPQEEINRLMVHHARAGKVVVRLKGGDPFVFGRGGEEALELASQGIPFEVVPGVTSGIAAAAYGGIPVTQREVSRSVTLVTGHHSSKGDGAGLGLANLGKEGTLVFYMGLSNLASIVQELKGIGRGGDTPAAVIEWGTFGRQRTITGSLDTIEAQATAAQVKTPAVCVVGEVVRFHEQLSWFECRPLHGIRFMVTRARAHPSKLVHELRALGGDVFEFPTQEVEPVDQADFETTGWDWIILTGVNAVEMLIHLLQSQGKDARDLAQVKLCVIGASTRDALRKYFLKPDFAPATYDASQIVTGMEREGGSMEGKKMVIPHSDIVDSALPESMRARGALVTELTTYTMGQPKDASMRASSLADYAPHLVVFTSSAAVKGLCGILEDDQLDELKNTASFAAMGPVTAKAALQMGIDISVEPEEHTVRELLKAIEMWAASMKAT